MPSSVADSNAIPMGSGEPSATPHVAGKGSKAWVWPFAALSIVFCLSYVRFFAYVWGRWMEDHGPFGYGYFVPPAIIYLLWAKRDLLRNAPTAKGPAWAWAICGAAIVGNLLSIIAAVTLLQSLTFVALIVFLPCCIWGMPKFKYMWGPLLYIGTMVPWPGQLINLVLFKMQHISIILANKMLNFFGMYTIVDGVTIHLPRYSFEVAAACAGLTILFPTVACTILTAMMLKADLWRKILLVALSVPVSILTNAGRIVLIGAIGNQGGTKLAAQLHDMSGFVGVIVSVIVLSILGSLIKASAYHDIYMPSWAREEEAK